MRRVDVVGALVRRFANLDTAEEAFQEAVLAALPSWRAGGVPANSDTWLMTVAKNHALDAARHRHIVDENAPMPVETDAVAPPSFTTIADDGLHLIFTCCHPVLTLDTQEARSR